MPWATLGMGRDTDFIESPSVLGFGILDLGLAPATIPLVFLDACVPATIAQGQTIAHSGLGLLGAGGLDATVGGQRGDAATLTQGAEGSDGVEGTDGTKGREGKPGRRRVRSLRGSKNG